MSRLTRKSQIPLRVVLTHSILLLCIGTATTPTDAWGQTDAAAARQLFEEGRALMKQERYAEACPKFEQSQQRNRGIGTLYNLADCWEHLGRTASAWATFRDVADEAARVDQHDREAVALKRAASLLPRLSYVKVIITEALAGLEVSRDSTVSVVADAGKPVALDPGDYVFEATAPDRQPWRAKISVPATGGTIEVVVPALPEVTPAAATGPTTVLPGERNEATAVERSADAATSGLSASDHRPPSSFSRQKYVAYAVGGVGLVGVAVGGVFGLKTLSKNDEANSICPKGFGCSAQEVAAYDTAVSDAKQARALSYAGFGVGGVALATSLILYLAAPKASATAIRFAPMVTRRQVGTTFLATF